MLPLRRGGVQGVGDGVGRGGRSGVVGGVQECRSGAGRGRVSPTAIDLIRSSSPFHLYSAVLYIRYTLRLVSLNCCGRSTQLHPEGFV